MGSSSKKRVYICSSLRPEVVEHVDNVLNNWSRVTAVYSGNLVGKPLSLESHTISIRPASDSVTLLRPNVQQTDDFIMDCVRADVWMIDQADELWVIGQFGKDCQWEIGYAMAKGKPVKMFKDETNKHLFDESWMYRLGFDMNLLEVIDVSSSQA